MTTIESTCQMIGQPDAPFVLDDEQLAVVAFLARSSGRTLEAYRHDRRALFGWAADHGLAVVDATRTDLELYRNSMEQHGLSALTIDRRLSTACGFYRFAHIDRRIASNPAQYVRRPEMYPSERPGLDRGELARFLFTGRALRSRPHRPGRAGGLERAAGLGGVRHQHRGHGHGAGTSGTAYRWQGPLAPPCQKERAVPAMVQGDKERWTLLPNSGRVTVVTKVVSPSSPRTPVDWNALTPQWQLLACDEKGKPGWVGMCVHGGATGALEVNVNGPLTWPAGTLAVLGVMVRPDVLLAVTARESSPTLLTITVRPRSSSIGRRRHVYPQEAGAVPEQFAVQILIVARRSGTSDAKSGCEQATSP